MDDDSAIKQNTSDPSNIDLTDNDGELNSLVEQLDLDSLRTLHLTSTQLEEKTLQHEGEEEEKGESSEQLPEEEDVVKFEFIKNVRHLKNEFSLMSLDPTKAASSVERNLMDKLMNVPLEGLVDLDLSKLNLKSGACLKLTRCFFAGLVSLESVDLEGNFISEMDPATFHNLPKLRKVNLKWNRLKILPACMFADSPMIQVVYLEKNNVEFIDPNAFNSCNELILVEISHNEIGRIQAGTFKDLPALTTLNLTSNRGEPMDLDVGAFENLPNLEHLYLNDNMIRELKNGVFRGLTNLILLDLSNNRIQKLNPEIFSDLESLQFINLDDNELSAPDVGLFKGLENLQNISMNGNGLENFEKLDLILEESVYYVSYRRVLGVKDSEHISEENSEELNDMKRIKRESIMSKASTMTTIEI